MGEYFGATYEYDAHGNLARRREAGELEVTVLLRYDAFGRRTLKARTRHATYFYQNDHLGTPLELVDESGKVVWLGGYRAWGALRGAKLANGEAAETGNLIRAQGQYHDEELGLHYNRYRYYEPYSGRFISKDPIGLAGGINVYQYAPNPITWVDPLGLRFDSPAEKLRRKLSALEGAQATADRTRVLPDGRIRYYDKEALARTVGPTRGRSHVTEWTPATDQVRAWEETYDFGSSESCSP
ncbi:RHS repeat-associated core domain containing protein-containing protein [Burkholderia sp. BT03]|nr:RHS repeat-associated core domain containing protein-containing protein [Burkholderia sp. BT03]